MLALVLQALEPLRLAGRCRVQCQVETEGRLDVRLPYLPDHLFIILRELLVPPSPPTRESCLVSCTCCCLVSGVPQDQQSGAESPG